jgi:CRISPR-associated endoribonuclease Cas6
MNYHKLQGFVYEKLISPTQFRNIHDKSLYKFFSYSNIFPPSPAKTGDHRYLLFASPDIQLVKSVFQTIKRIMIESKHSINIGEQKYILASARMIDLIIKSRTYCTIYSATPITARIPEANYSKFCIPIELRKNKFLYWRSNLPTDIFIKLIENNMQKKYELFFNEDIGYMFPLIEEFSFLKEVIVHIPVGQSTLKIPASFWQFDFRIIDKVSHKLLHFILDSGVGERNSFGLGFINATGGTKIVEIDRIANN